MNMVTQQCTSKVSDYWVQFEFLTIIFGCDLTPLSKLLSEYIQHVAENVQVILSQLIAVLLVLQGPVQMPPSLQNSG